MNTTIFIVGNLPPPIGGVNTHVQRLIDLLVSKNYNVEVYELSGKRDLSFDYDNKPNIRIWAGLQVKVFMYLVWRGFVASPQLIHWHMSAGGNLIRISPVLILLSWVFPNIFTIHSGSFPEWVKSQNRLRLVLFGYLFRSALGIIAVNSSIKKALVDIFNVRQQQIKVIPAYISSVLPIRGEPVMEKANDHTVKLISSGYATPIYWWEGLLKAVSTTTKVDELILVFYSRYDEPYYSQILDQASKISTCKVQILNNLDQKTFLKLLCECDIFVRPTLTDGDSIALREALDNGLLVIASDAVVRPDSCILFKTFDALDLLQKIEMHVPVNEKRLPRINDFSEELMVFYHYLIDRS